MTILECNNVTKHFGALAAVENISFSLEEGEIVGMIGPNGAGKTTLFNCIIGVYKPTNGKIRFLNSDIVGLKPHKICRLGLTKTSQITEPFRAMTVFENVLVGAMYGGRMGLKEGRRQTDEVLELVGLSDQKNKPSDSISVPARRRMELAKALASKPRLLLLDENMAGLNPYEIDEALELLRRIRTEGMTLVVVEHIMRAVLGISDRIIVLNYGAKIAEGTPSEVMRNEQVIQAYFGEKTASGL